MTLLFTPLWENVTLVEEVWHSLCGSLYPRWPPSIPFLPMCQVQATWRDPGDIMWRESKEHGVTRFKNEESLKKRKS